MSDATILVREAAFQDEERHKRHAKLDHHGDHHLL